MRPKLAIDIDQTICQTVRLWMDHLITNLQTNPVAGIAIPKESALELTMKFGGIEHVPEWAGTPFIKESFARMDKDPALYDALPCDGAAAALHELAKQVDIEYLTMREPWLEAATRAWLDRHGFPAGEVTFCPSEVPPREREQWKADHLSKRPELLGIVDDRARIAMALPPDYHGAFFLIYQNEAPRTDIPVFACRDWCHGKEVITGYLNRVLHPSLGSDEQEIARPQAMRP